MSFYRDHANMERILRNFIKIAEPRVIQVQNRIARDIS